jgi:hypothetical protein
MVMVFDAASRRIEGGLMVLTRAISHLEVFIEKLANVIGGHEMKIQLVVSKHLVWIVPLSCYD